MATSSASEMFSCKTSVESVHSVLNWEIQKFSLICPNPNLVIFQEENRKEFFARINPLLSPMLTTSLDRDQRKLQWYLSMKFTAGADDGPVHRMDENFMSIFLNVRDPSKCPEILALIYTVSVIGPDGVEALKRSTTMPSPNPQFPGWGWPQFISVKSLWANPDTFFVKDTLHLRVELNVTCKVITENITRLPPCPRSLATDLCEDLEQLLKSKEGADITVHCGEKDFLIHSTIVKARSPVFQRMFDAGMTESVDKVVKIEDVDPVDFEALIEYLYTATIGFPLDDISRFAGLVRVADKYEVVKLKAFCFEHISRQISLENVGEIAVLTYLHCAKDEIRNTVVSFCIKNWEVLISNEAFQNCVRQNPAAFFKN